MANTFHWNSILVIMGAHRHFVVCGTVLVFSEVSGVLIFVMVDEIFKEKNVLSQHMEVNLVFQIVFSAFQYDKI